MSTLLPAPIHSYERAVRHVPHTKSLKSYSSAPSSTTSNSLSPLTSPFDHIEFSPNQTSQSSSLQQQQINEDDTISPLAAMHRAVLQQKTQSLNKSQTTEFSHTHQHQNQLHNHHHHHHQQQHSHLHGCAVHSAIPHTSSITSLPLSHPHARPSYCSVSSTCCLPRASFWNTRCSCIFSAVPDEVLLFNVFSCLPAPELCRLASVCSRWKFLTTDPLLWRHVDLSKYATRVADTNVFDTLMSRIGTDVKTLKLCNLKSLNYDSLLRLGDSYLTSNPDLRSLHLCSIRTVDYAVLSNLFSNATLASSIRELSLYGCVNVDDACVQLIRRKCVRLQELNLRGCVKVTDAAFINEDGLNETPSPTGELQVIDTTSKLTEVVEDPLDLVRSSSFSSTSSVVSELSASSFASAAISASSASISPSSATFGRFAYLTSLNVATCKLLTEAGLIAMVRASPLLKTLNLHGLNPTDALIDSLTSYCPLLTTLHLSSSNPFGGNVGLTDVGIDSISSRLTQLESLNLQGSSRITDASILLLIDRCRRLTKLNLGGCFKLTDASVIGMCQAANNSRYQLQFTHLSLFQCVALTNASLQAIAHSMHFLQHLDVHSCTSITDDGILALVQENISRPSSLTSVTASSLDDDDDETHSLPTVSSFYLPYLRTLDVGSCRKITKEGIARVHAIRPQLQLTHY